MKNDESQRIFEIVTSNTLDLQKPPRISREGANTILRALVYVDALDQGSDRMPEAAANAREALFRFLNVSANYAHEPEAERVVALWLNRNEVPPLDALAAEEITR